MARATSRLRGRFGVELLAPVAVVATASSLKLLAGRWLASDVEMLFFAAVSLVAWRLGLRAALSATALSTVA